MDLGCPLLRGSFVRRLRRRAATARYVATDLVTSQNFQPIHCAFMLCQFGQTRNVYVATRFILLSSTAESSARSGHVAVPEHFLQNDEPSVNNVEGAREKPSFVPKMD